MTGKPGAPRIPILDTGHRRIHLSRITRYSQNRSAAYKAIAVLSAQTVVRDGKAVTIKTPMGEISEPTYRKKPKESVRRFYRFLDDALAISHYIDQELEQGRTPAELIHVDDLPAPRTPAEGSWSHLSLSKLFESFSPPTPQFQPSTTNRNPEAVAAELQQADLRQPRKPVALNGFHMKFKPTQIGSETFYLPTGICRVRAGWRVFLRHQDGIWHDYLEDDTQGTPVSDSLRDAWQYLISEMRNCAPPRQRLAPITNQAFFTGIEGGSFMISNRCGSFGFQLRYSQKDRRGRRHNITVRYWNEDMLSDKDLRLALRELAAMDTYRKFQIQQSDDPDFIVERETHIPLQFWPAEPVIPLYADDLLYEVEQRKS